MKTLFLSLALLFFMQPVFAVIDQRSEEVRSGEVSDPTYGGKVYRAWHIASVYVGATKWQEENGHFVDTYTLNFKDEAIPAWGGQYLFLFDWGLGVGISTQLYEKTVTMPSGIEPAKVLHGHAILQYHFNRGKKFKPFVGVGTGVAAIGFEGGVLDGEELTGISYELTAGATWRITQTIGVLAQYRYISFNIDEETIGGQPTSIDTSSNSILVGASFYF